MHYTESRRGFSFSPEGRGKEFPVLSIPRSCQ